MLDRLRRSEQAGVERGRAFIFLHDLCAFVSNADDCIAGLVLRLLVDGHEDLFEPRHVTLGLGFVFGESPFQRGACAAFSILGSVARIFFSAK